MLTIILCSLVGLVVLLALIGLFMPSTVSVEHSVTIELPVDKIFPWVAELRLWPQWTAGNKVQDSTMVYTYPGPTTGLGGSVQWTGKKMGKGTLTFTEFTPNQVLRYEQRMPCTTAQGNIEFESAGGGATRVSWYDDVHMGANPFIKLLGPVLRKMLGRTFALNLAGLKAAAMTGQASGPGPK